LNEKFQFKIVNLILKFKEIKDIDQIKSLLEEMKDTFPVQSLHEGSLLASLKKEETLINQMLGNNANITQLTEIIGDIQSIFSPFNSSGEINENYIIFQILDQDDRSECKQEFSKRRSIYTELNQIYSRCFSQYLEGGIPISIDLLNLLFISIQYFESFGKFLLSKEEDLNLQESLGLFASLFELVSKLLIIVVKEIYFVKEKKRFIQEEPILHNVINYLSSLDKGFLRIYNTYVRKEFRHMSVHHSWIQLDGQRFYNIKNKRKIFSRADLRNALLDLVVFFQVFWDLSNPSPKM